MDYDATRALAGAIRHTMEREARARAYADEVVHALEDTIKEHAEHGNVQCVWRIPTDDHQDFDPLLTQKAIRHYLRSGGFYWSQKGAEYVIRWSATRWEDYLRPNDWDTRYRCTLM